jgi:hypothetical protein
MLVWFAHLFHLLRRGVAALSSPPARPRLSPALVPIERRVGRRPLRRRVIDA